MPVSSADYTVVREIKPHYSMVEDLLLNRPSGDPMLVEGSRISTAGELRDEVSRIAGGLRALGVEAGDRVAVTVPQSHDAAVSHLAILWLGAVTVPLSVREASSSREQKLARADTTALIFDPMIGSVPSFCAAISTDTTEKHNLPQLRQAEPVPPARTRRDDAALLVFTSGTTGAPRGALLPHRILPARLPAFCLAQDHAPKSGDRFWTAVEWTWVGSLVDSLFTPWAMGIPVVAHPGTSFDPEQAAAIVEQFEVRNIFLPPTALRMMASADLRVRTPIRALHSGGEPLSAGVISWAKEALGIRPNEIYGQTEASFLVGSGGFNGHREGFIGRAYPPHNLQLLDDQEQPVSVGDVGEICVPGDDPTLFLGYLGEGPASPGAWWHTGDLALADEDGYLKFISRKDDLIISAGYRVDPVQIENALMRHPAVALAAVVGQPDAIRGQIPVAYVTLRGQNEAGLDDIKLQLLADLTGEVPGYARPQTINVVDELPLTSTGKVARSRLRAWPPQ